MAVSSQTPSGNINAVPEIIKLIRPVAISINASSGNINIVLEIYTYTSSGYLNTAEIEKHIHTPSVHINTVSINSTYMLSDNLNTCAINKYTNTPVVTIVEQQQHGKFLRPVANSIQFENNIYTFYAQWEY